MSLACSQPSSQLRVNTVIGSGGVRKGGRVRPVGRMAGCGTGHHSGHPRLGTIVQGSLKLSTLWGFRGSDIPSGTRACPTHVSCMALSLAMPSAPATLTSWGEGAAEEVCCAQWPSSEGLPGYCSCFLCATGMSHSHAMITGVSLYI